MKTPETLLLIGAAGLGVYALSKQEGSGLGGITNILEAPGDGGGGLLPAINFPAFNFPAFNWPDINLPAVPEFNWPELPDMPTLPKVPKLPGGKGLAERAGEYLAGGVKSNILGFGQGLWNAGAEERAGYEAFAEGVAQPTWMPFGRLIEGFKRMANQMSGGGHLGGVSPGIGISEQNPLDPYERLDVNMILGYATGAIPGDLPEFSAAKKPGATPADTEGEASAKQPESFYIRELRRRTG